MPAINYIRRNVHKADLTMARARHGSYIFQRGSTWYVKLRIATGRVELGKTGARLREAFQINSKATKRGVRYVVIGSKTEASRRRVPCPKSGSPLIAINAGKLLVGESLAH